MTFLENNIEFDFINDKTTFDPDVIHKLKYKYIFFNFHGYVMLIQFVAII